MKPLTIINTTASIEYIANIRFPRVAKVLKGRPEPKQATPVPACNGMKTRIPDENDKKGDPQKLKAAFRLVFILLGNDSQ